MKYATGSATGGGGFRPYAAGVKRYGSGRTNPTMGRVDPLGYKERDAMQQARRNAILRRLKANMAGKYASSDSLRNVR